MIPMMASVDIAGCVVGAWRMLIGLSGVKKRMLIGMSLDG
jgi:hypothetical protein